MSDLLLVEGVRDRAGSVAEAMRVFADVGEERGHPGHRVVVNGSGSVWTPVHYTDSDIAIGATGTASVCRKLSQTAIGRSAPADFAVEHLCIGDVHMLSARKMGHLHNAIAHKVALSIEGEDPDTDFADLAINLGDQVYAGTLDGGMAMPLAVVQAVASCPHPDGRHIAILEQTGAPNIEYLLWELDLLSGARRLVTAFAQQLSPRLSYSGDGRWLLVSAGGAPGPTIVEMGDGLQGVLPGAFRAAAWDPTHGPNVVVGATFAPGATTAQIGRLDLSTLEVSWEGQVELELRDSYLLDLDVSADGRWLAAVAPVGLASSDAEDNGTAGRAVVVDLESMTFEQVLPARFQAGPERDHRHPTWVQRRLAAGETLVAESFCASMIPAPGPPGAGRWAAYGTYSAGELVGALLDGHVRAAVVRTEALRFVWSALEYDASEAEWVDGMARAVAGRVTPAAGDDVAHLAAMAAGFQQMASASRRGDLESARGDIDWDAQGRRGGWSGLGIEFDGDLALPQVQAASDDRFAFFFAVPASARDIATQFAEEARGLNRSTQWTTAAGYAESPLPDGSSFRMYLLPCLQGGTVAILTAAYSSVSTAVIERLHDFEMPMRNAMSHFAADWLPREHVRDALLYCSGLSDSELRTVCRLLSS